MNPDREISGLGAPAGHWAHRESAPYGEPILASLSQRRETGRRPPALASRVHANDVVTHLQHQIRALSADEVTEPGESRVIA